MEKMEQDRVYGVQDLQRIGSEMLKQVAEICEREKIPYCLFFGSMLGAVRHHGPIPWDYDIDIAIHENDLERFVAVMEQQLPDRFWIDFRDDRNAPKTFPRIGLSGFDTYDLHIDVYRMVGFPDSLAISKWIVRLGRLLLEMRIVKAADLEHYEGKKKEKIRRLRRLLCCVSAEFIVKRYDALCRRYPYETSKKVGLNACLGGIRYIYEPQTIDDTILVDYLDFQVRIPREYDFVLRSIYGDYQKLPRQAYIDSEMSKQYRLKPWNKNGSV